MKKYIPLAERMRPEKLEDVVGQSDILGKRGFITACIKKKKPLSFILWGPPGSGKTSIARLYAKAFSLPFETITPIFSGVADLKNIIKDTEGSLLLFVDEIHRFNKAQQDAFLPSLESGKLILVGSTVENPSFYLIPALLSRVRVLKLKALDESALEKILVRYEKEIKPLHQVDHDGRKYLIHLSHGDGRYLLNLIEAIEDIDKPLKIEELEFILQEKVPLFDKDSDQHYNLISALHKSIRGSDPDASLYWFSRMILGGEDPLYIARRLIRVASEDIGLSDPQALVQAIMARDAYQMLGSPEGELALAQAIVYLALAPKSNAIYKAFNASQSFASETNHLPPPAHILNAPTPLMKEMGYGKGYIYDHETPQGFSGQNYFPESLKRSSFYKPTERGFEKDIHERLQLLNKLRKKIF